VRPALAPLPPPPTMDVATVLISLEQGMHNAADESKVLARAYAMADAERAEAEA
jgi:hypothetical protein